MKMKNILLGLMTLLFVMLISAGANDPARFGNLTDTTVMIGGAEGIIWINMTNLIYANASLGRVGIGTINPSRKLHVNASVDNGVALFESTDDYSLIWFKDNPTTTIAIGSYQDQFIVSNSNLDNIRMVINYTSGNVGIGKLTPTAKLDVDGLVNASEFSGAHNWSDNQNYPSACPANTYVSQINDSITCTAITNISNNVTIGGNINSSSYNNIHVVKGGDWDDFVDIVTNDCTGDPCTIILPSGTYTADTPINISSNTTIQGYGDATYLLTDSGSFGGRWYFQTNAKNIKIKDLFIDSQNTSGKVMGLYNSEHENIEMSGVHYKGNAQGIGFKGTNIVFRNNFIDDCGNGVSFDSENEGAYYLIENNRIINEQWNSSSPTEYGEGIEINNHRNGTAIVTGNYIEGFREDGIDGNIAEMIATNNVIKGVCDESRASNLMTAGVNTVYGNYSTNMIINGNYLYNTNPNGVALHAGGQLVTNNSIIFNNNFVSGCPGGTTAQRGLMMYAGLDDRTVIGNHFENLYYAIRDHTTNDGLYIGNTFRDNTDNLYLFSPTNYTFISEEETLFMNNKDFTVDADVNFYNSESNPIQIVSDTDESENLAFSVNDYDSIFTSNQDEAGWGGFDFILGGNTDVTQNRFEIYDNESDLAFQVDVDGNIYLDCLTATDNQTISMNGARVKLTAEGTHFVSQAQNNFYWKNYGGDTRMSLVGSGSSLEGNLCIGDNCRTLADHKLDVRGNVQLGLSGSNQNHTINIGDAGKLRVARTFGGTQGFTFLTTGSVNSLLSIGKDLHFGTTDNEPIIFKVNSNTQATFTDGATTFTGNADFGGNITGANYYGGMYIFQNETATSFASASVPYNITNGMTAGHLNGFSYASGVLTVTNTGIYKLDSSVSFNGQASNEYHTTIGINGVIQENCHASRKLGATGDVGNVGVSCLIDLTAGEEITLMMSNVDSAGGPTVTDANIVLLGVNT